MAIMWSRIHAELGLSPRPLTHDMVVQAVAQQARENEDLDWKQDLAWKKRDLPADKKEEKKQEFAKDVAAMANTRGGLIIFGVEEDNEAAIRVTGVPNDERERQALRALAWQRVKPLIDGLAIEALNNDAGDEGLIVVSVPASPDSPHVVGEQNKMGVPYRDGSDTRWMTEGQLERAYRDRFARRADDRAALSALIDDLVPEVPLDGVWVAVSARPVAPMPLAAARPQREQATATMNEMRLLASEIYPLEGDRRIGRIGVIAGLDGYAVNNPRAGLRRWVIRSNPYSTDPTDKADWGHVELHHDGSLALAVGFRHWARGKDAGKDAAEVHRVPVRAVDSLLVEAVALAATHVRSLGGAGTILIRAMFLQDPASPSRPLVAVDDRTHLPGFKTQDFYVLDETRAVRNSQAVEAQFAATDDAAALRQVARQLAEDLDHQFGMQRSMIPQ